MYISSAITKITTAFVAGCAIVSAADNMKYKVVSYVPANHTAGVMIDGQVYPLKVQDESSLYFTSEAPVAQSGYQYVVLDSTNNVTEQENFTRTPITEGDTLNEYYNRSWNSMNLTQLPTVLEPLPIINRIDSDLHIDGEIPTIHITGNQTAIDYMHANPTDDSDIPVYMTYISPNDVKELKNVSIALSGHSTRSAAKLSYKIKIDKKAGDLYDYRRLKLRAMSMDTSYMKEELAYDIAKKMGLPTSETSYVRVYFNDQPLGLFGLVEVYKNPWQRNVFANGEKYNQGAFYVADVNLGAPVATFSGGGMTDKMPTSASQLSNISMPSNTSNSSFQFGVTLPGNVSVLTYLGDNVTAYEAPYPVKEDPSVGTANYTRLMELTKFIAQQPNDTMVDDSYADAWEKVLDVDSALRELALEVLLSDMDGYAAMGNNYILYDDLENERIVMSGQDFDLTMGLIANDQYVTGNYSEFQGFAQRPLTTTVLKVPKYKQRFEDILYNATVNLLNPDVLYPRIDALSNFLAQDVEWDKSLPAVANSSFDFTSMVPFSLAVNGSVDELTAGNSSLGAFADALGIKTLFLKEWVQLRSDNLMAFFNGTAQNSTTSA